MGNTVHSVSIKAELDAKNAQATAEKLHKTIKATKEDAASIPTGGKALAAAYKGSTSSNELTQYGQTRAMRPGGTGASARDFAQEAQGLGGLVRLYATYAANVFAVAAAFNALQAAQDTANMVKGLNQLGAASGVALGSLSKDLVKATDGAVSLREAMEATVKASSSGMVSKDILRMGEVAKKASQALGINMPDALSRISRGITKLEPELLDELGIFTRIDPAVQAYAKLVNKSVSDLSQFERQMAFSNAALEEGERKFGAINIQTNAYTQLLAKLKDAATTIGDTLNVALVPIVKLLSSSPTALFTLIGAMALMVAKQAIPAFANMRSAMLESMTQVSEVAKEKQKGLMAHMDNLAANAKRLSYKVMEDTDNMLAASQTKLLEYEKKMGKRGITAPSKQFLDANSDSPITPQLVKELEAQAKLAEKNKQKNAELYRELATTAALHYEKEQAFQKTAIEDANKRISKTLEYKAAVLELQQTQNAQTKATIINAATEKANIEGLRAGYRSLREDIRTKREDAERAKKEVKEGNLTNVGATGFGKIAAGVTLVSGAFSLLSGIINKGLSVVAPYLELLALAGIAFAIFDLYMDKTTELASKFNDALTSTQDSTKTLTENIDRLNTLKINEFFNPETIKGTSTAIITIADNILTLGQKFLKLQVAQAGSWWARRKDDFASMWGGDTQSKFTDGVADSITSLLKNLDKAPAKFKSTSEAITKLTGVSDPTNLNAMEKALKGMDPKSEKFKELLSILQQLKVDVGNLATDVAAFKTSLTEFGDATQALSNQFIDKDPLTTFALKGLAASDKLNKALKGELVGAVSAIGEALEDLGKKPLFGLDADIAQLGKMKVALEGMQKALPNNEREIKELIEERAKVQKEINVDAFGNTSLDDAKIESLSKQIKMKQQQLSDARSNAPQLVAEIQELSNKGANSFLEILDAKIAVTMAKGGSAFMNAVASALGNLPGVATMRADAQLADIGFQQNLIKLQMQMLEQQTLSRINSDILVQEAEVARIAIRDPSNATQAATMASQKLDKMKAEKATIVKTKDPRELLALSKDKSGETASALREFALAKTGMFSQLKALGDQAAGIVFTKKVEELGAEIDARKKVLDIVKQSNTETLANIDLQEKLNGGISDEDVLRRSTLVQENIRLDTSKEILDNLSRQAVLDFAISSNVASAKAKQSALDEKANLNKQLQNTYAKLARELAQEEYAARLKILDNAKKEEAFQLNKLDLAEQTKKTLESTKLNTYESDIGIQKDYGVDTGAQDLQLQSMKDAEAFRAQARATELAQRKEIFDLEQRRAALDTTSTEYARLTEIIGLTNQKYAAITAGEAAAKQYGDARLEVQKQILAVTREQEIATLKVQLAAESLAAVFGTVGEAAGNLLTTLDTVATNRATQASAESSAEQKLTKLREDRSKIDMAEEGSFEKLIEANGKIESLEKDLLNLKKKGAIQEQKDDISIISSTKKVFGEKTFAYKALGAVEKAMHVAKLAMFAAEVAANFSTVGATVAAEGTKNVAKGTGAILLALSAPFPINFIAGAAMAAIVASLLGGSGPSIPSGYDSASRQETQGTGQSYDSNGNLYDNGGGVLGDRTAQNKDITNSIDKLSNLTLDGNQVSGNVLKLLEMIEYNTSSLANSLYMIEGLTGGKSGFGTIEGKSGGFLGIGATTTTLLDTGFKVADSIDKAAIRLGTNAEFLQYETVNKKSSGLFGLFSSSDTFDNIKALDQSVSKDINNIFTQSIEAYATALSEAKLGLKNELITALTNAIDLTGFKVSVKDMKPEEATAAIEAVVGEFIGKGIRVTMNIFDQFRKAGEGTEGAAIRVASEMKYVKRVTAYTSNNFKLLGATVVSNAEELSANVTAARDRVTEAERSLAAAKAASLAATPTEFNSMSYEDSQAAPDAERLAETNLTAARAALTTATDTQTNATYANEISNIALTQSLIDGAGGIVKFRDQTEFFIENFLTDSQRALQNYRSFTETVAENDTLTALGVSARMTRTDYANLIAAQDLNSEAGRRNWQVLMDNAEAFDSVATQAEETGQFLTDKFLEAVEAGYSPAATGKYVADSFLYSIQRTMYDSTVGEIMNTFSAGIITPILNAAKSGANASTLIAMLAGTEVDATLSKMRVMAETLAKVMNSAEWKRITTLFAEGIGTVTAGLQGSLPQINMVSPSIVSVGSAANSTTSSAEDLAKALKELADAALGSTKTLFNNAISKYKSMQSELKSGIDRMKEFIKSLKDFRTNLLLGDKSTLTPAQKYLKAKSEFDATVAKAKAGDTVAQEKLQSVLDAFLTSSREFYASGDQYSADFESVLQAVDDTITSAGTAQKTMEDELVQVNKWLGKLGQIDTTLLNIESILALDKGQASADILTWLNGASNPLKGSASVTMDQLIAAGILKKDGTENTIFEMLGGINGVLAVSALTDNQNRGALTNALTLLAQSGFAISEAITLLQTSSPTPGSYGVGNRGFYTNGTAFATGTTGKTDATIDFRYGDGYSRISQQNAKAFLTSMNFTSEWAKGPAAQGALINMLRGAGFDSSMLAYILTDSGTTGSLKDTGDAIRAHVLLLGLQPFAQGIDYVPYDMPAYIHEGERIFPKADNEELMKSVKGNNNAELIAEIRTLNNKVASLERTVAQGAAVNAQATDRNTEAVVGAVSDSTNRTIQSNNIRERATLR